MQIHLLPNAHLDPVWLWDWREGLGEGLTTVKTILDLMDRNDDLTFVRGESSIYEHIERTDPGTFSRIVKRVEEGRWDVVGGTYVQPDTNLPAAETLARQFTRGQRYFQSRFGKKVRVAWQADSFGHTAGLPEILAAAGIESFTFTRPENKLLPLAEPAFWWQGAGGARILCYRPSKGWYGTNRDDMRHRLDTVLENAQWSRLETAGCFFGLGNHGGGPSLQQLKEIRKWADEHPDIEVIFSGFHRFFEALRAELRRKPALFLPVVEGELNFCLRGCYSSAARFKFLYRKGENLLTRAEKTDSAISALTRTPAADLNRAWDGVLFNSFHDILPGSSIERAMDDQVGWMGSVVLQAQEAEFAALNRLAMKVDTRVQAPPYDHPSAVAALVWNPHPHPYHGHVEVEACLDYRPIEKYRDRCAELPLRMLGPGGEALPFQEVAVENRSIMGGVPWRKRVVVPVTLPACGWNVLEFGWVEGAEKIRMRKPLETGDTWIDNGYYRVSAKKGGKGIAISHGGRDILTGDGLTAQVFEDPWGSWGGMAEEKDSYYLDQLREHWRVADVRLLEKGPERASLWVRLAGKNSRIDLTLSVYRQRKEVVVSARAMWDERSARLKLCFPAGDRAEFEVPAATVKRGPLGEVPGGRWARVSVPRGGFGLASDALYNFDCADGALRATVVRSTRFADDIKTGDDECPWVPATDCGELKFRFTLAPSNADLPRLADELEQPPLVQLVTPRKGPLGRSGSAATLRPESLRLLALKPAEKGRGFVVRVQGPAGPDQNVELDWLGKTISLGPIKGGSIASWLLDSTSAGWKAIPVDLAENKIPPAKKK